MSSIWENGASSSARGVRISKPSGISGDVAENVMLAGTTHVYPKDGRTLYVLFEDRSSSMTSNLLLNPRFWDDRFIEVDIALFPCPFSPCNHSANKSPVVLLSILAQAPLLEISLILCFAAQELESQNLVWVDTWISIPSHKYMIFCHGLHQAFKLEVIFHIQRFDCSLVAFPFRVSLVTGGHTRRKELSQNTPFS